MYFLPVALLWTFVLCSFSFTESLVRNRLHRHSSIERRASRSVVASETSGGHGEGFKYLPTITGSNEEHFPRILQIAGVFPDLSVADVLAVSSTPAAPAGMWTYDFSDPDGPQLGTVAIPGSDLITGCADPVALITTNTVLGVPSVEEVEMIVVVDRGDRDFVSRDFFLFQKPGGELSIQWRENLDEGYAIVGRVALCLFPWTSAMQPKSSGFLEDE